MHHNFFAIGNKPSELLKSNSTGGAVQAAVIGYSRVNQGLLKLISSRERNKC